MGWRIGQWMWSLVLGGACCTAALAQTTPVAALPSRNAAPEVGQSATTYVPSSAPPQQMMRQTGGSLFKASLAIRAEPISPGRPLPMSYGAVPEQEPKTLKKHDLVTIIIREESEISAEGTTDLKRQTDVDARINEMVRLSLDKMSLVSNAQGKNPPAVNIAGTNNFKGEATVDRTDSFTARVTAEVLDVKPNGTLVLQAKKHIKNDDEEQLYILTGVCRVEDISPDNTILSTQLHDVDLTKDHKGAVHDTTKRGFLTKMLNAINPF